jgi:hypothetical protein
LESLSVADFILTNSGLGANDGAAEAMQLGWFPGVRIRQTSSEEYGQIYVPFVNWTMMMLTVALTVSFGSSDRLAGRLWYRRFDHHAADDGAALQRHARALALAGRTGADREWPVSRC